MQNVLHRLMCLVLFGGGCGTFNGHQVEKVSHWGIGHEGDSLTLILA